ncbi:MAG TPA: glycosyltransferase family 2 protein [Clostridia bacterium]|nr:glycosyltransferase family 2 protein [Clostridia bacterium]
MSNPNETIKPRSPEWAKSRASDLPAGTTERLAFNPDVLTCEIEKLHGQFQELQHRLQSEIDRLDVIAQQIRRALPDPATSSGKSAATARATATNEERSLTPYQQLVRRVWQVVAESVPLGATVLVVSKGDPSLLTFTGQTGWHFPRTLEGQYPGYHPACSTAAIANLEALRARGAKYFLIPSCSFWWFEHYPAFKLHLDKNYRLVVQRDDTCLLYSLCQQAEPGPAQLVNEFERFLCEFELQFDGTPVVLDWHSGLDLSELPLEATVFSPEQASRTLPYLDRSVDIVVAPSEEAEVMNEARRVAKVAVLTSKDAGPDKGPQLCAHWTEGRTQTPQASVAIIIPCFNGVGMTNACLESLFATLPRGAEVRIVVVDDASDDGTAACLRRWAGRDSRIIVLRNRTNLGFVDSCNRGARRAGAEMLVFLNNDVVLLPGWLPPLLRVFRESPNVGAVGGKLILPDGKLQEAGGVVFSDGSAMNFGRGDTDLDDPLYNAVREVHYCSGALLATPRRLFRRLGGFDDQYRPGYYEDTDYCFKLRVHGYRVFFQPESAVVHWEGGSGGQDQSGGMKQYQAINQAKFAARWKAALEGYPIRPGKVDKAVLQHLARVGNLQLPEVKP